ncbi:hypothetical protein CBNA_1316 [Coxiella burnetii str. Namibia]|nr:hypothetical protein CBNA_1316 [Coxiella burnetii str. Namibia]
MKRSEIRENNDVIYRPRISLRSSGATCSKNSGIGIDFLTICT